VSNAKEGTTPIPSGTRGAGGQSSEPVMVQTGEMTISPIAIHVSAPMSGFASLKTWRTASAMVRIKAAVANGALKAVAGQKARAPPRPLIEAPCRPAGLAVVSVHPLPLEDLWDAYSGSQTKTPHRSV
jgi:hypothetical protein